MSLRTGRAVTYGKDGKRIYLPKVYSLMPAFKSGGKWIDPVKEPVPVIEKYTCFKVTEPKSDFQYKNYSALCSNKTPLIIKPGGDYYERAYASELTNFSPEDGIEPILLSIKIVLYKCLNHTGDDSLWQEFKPFLFAPELKFD